MYGVLHELAKKRFYNIDNIESIYSTSVGSLLGAMLALKIDNDINISIKVKPCLSFTNSNFITFSNYKFYLQSLDTEYHYHPTEHAI